MNEPSPMNVASPAPVVLDVSETAADHASPRPSKAARLRALLESPALEFIMEAHNGISARIVQEAGFKGIWGSGLTLSAQFGVRDNNEASWTQIVELIEFMSDATEIPILLDGDTGYGNFNNMRRLVKKLEQRQVAGVCIEDKLFPKTNSFIDGERQPLCEVEEFCSKISAGRDSRQDPDFCIVARVEALIAGWGLDEALRRAEAYHQAGADAILIHSKRSRPDEILAFAAAWGRRCPLVIVPTKYYSTPTEVFRRAGISLVIWANHLLRAAVARMTTVAREIQSTQTLISVEDQVAPLKEIFRLQGAEELARAEQQYAASRRVRTGAIVLAASRGHAMESLTEYRPKAMLPVAGKPLLRHLVDAFKTQRIHRITVVAGYQARAIEEAELLGGVAIVHNPRHTRSGELASLACARPALEPETIITYGDLLFRRYVLRDLLAVDAELSVVVDSALPPRESRDFRDVAYCSRPDEHAMFARAVDLERVVARPAPDVEPPAGRWIGMLRVRGEGRRWLAAALDELAARPDFDALDMIDLLNHLRESGRRIAVVYIHGHWLDVNRLEDLARANDFTQGRGDFRNADDRG